MWGRPAIFSIEEMGQQGLLIDVCKIRNMKTVRRHLFAISSNTRTERQMQTRGSHSSHTSANPMEPLTDCQKAHTGSKGDILSSYKSSPLRVIVICRATFGSELREIKDWKSIKAC